MPMPTPLRSLLAAPLFATTLGMSGCPFPFFKDVYPVDPPVLAVAPLPVPPASTVDLTIYAPVDLIRDAAESAVPRRLHADDYTIAVNGGLNGGGVDFGYTVDRSPLRITANGNTLTTDADLTYDIKARKRVIFPIYVHCGPGDNPAPGARVRLVTSVDVDPQWNPVVHTQAQPATATGDCRLGFAGFNATPYVLDALNRALAAAVPQLDAKAVGALKLRDALSSAWSQLQAPVPLGGSAYLMVHPDAVGISPIRMDNATMTIGVHLSAHPQVVVGTAPATEHATLPDAQPAVPGNGFTLVVPVDISTDYITAELRKALRIGSGGVRYPPDGRFYLSPTDVELTAYGDKVVVRLALDGSAKATVYLTGTPHYDPVTNVMDVPNLDYTVETKNLLVKIADWAEGQRALVDLRQRLRVDLGAQTAQARQAVASALNRQVGPLRLSGTLGSLQLLGVYPNPTAGTVRAYLAASGTATAEVTP